MINVYQLPKYDFNYCYTFLIGIFDSLRDINFKFYIDECG